MSILRADSIRDRAGTGAPDFPNGLTGNVTGTASTATVATNAQGITGTPNITVGTVTGTDATFSGNLTVNGTTTTIDTAVTAVDSLSVDGAIAFAGGKANGLSNADGVDLRLRSDTTNDQVFAIYKNGAGDAQRTAFINSDGSAEFKSFITADRTGSTEACFHSRLNGSNTSVIRANGSADFDGTVIFKGGLAEKFNNTGGTMSSGTHAIQSGNIIRFTGNESGANALNITGIHSTLANGEALSFTVICTPNNSGYISGFNIDGVTPATSIYWSGGSAPSAGGASGRDVYTFTVLKTGTGTNAYEVYGAVTNYA